MATAVVDLPIFTDVVRRRVVPCQDILGPDKLRMGDRKMEKSVAWDESLVVSPQHPEGNQHSQSRSASLPPADEPVL